MQRAYDRISQHYYDALQALECGRDPEVVTESFYVQVGAQGSSLVDADGKLSDAAEDMLMLVCAVQVGVIEGWAEGEEYVATWEAEHE